MIAGEEIITDAEHYTYTVKVIKEILFRGILTNSRHYLRV